MERMIINPDQRTIPCASIDCDKLVQVAELTQVLLKQGGIDVVVCECGKAFEIESEKKV